MKKTMQGKALILSVSEGLTANKIAEYREQLEKLLPGSAEYDTCMLDLEQTNNVDSTGVTFVIGVYKKMKSLNKKFCVIGANDDVQSLFRLMKLDQFFEMKN